MIYQLLIYEIAKILIGIHVPSLQSSNTNINDVLLKICMVIFIQNYG